jgi:hypothetical protein
MSAVSENESWVVERGAVVIEKKAQSSVASLSAWEQLVYCLWVADYMMRNAGDFANAVDMNPDFQSYAKLFAEQLSLPATCDAFSFSQGKLQREYFERFEAICNEIRSAEPGAAPNGGPATRPGNSGVTEGLPSVS